MESKNNKVIKNQISDFSEKKISRKEAIKKTGYMALSTATMMILLNENAQARNRKHGHARDRTRTRNSDGYQASDC